MTSTIKVSNRYGCTGNFKGFQTALPDELYGHFKVDEFHSIITDFNKIIKIPVVAILIFLILETVAIVALFVAITRQIIVLTYVCIGISILLSVFLVTFTLIRQSSLNRRMEEKALTYSQQYYSKGITFNVKPKYLSCSGKKFRYKLTIQYPIGGVVQVPIQQIHSYQFIPPAHFYEVPRIPGTPQSNGYMQLQDQQQSQQQPSSQSQQSQQQQPQQQQPQQIPQPMYFQQFYPHPASSTSNPFSISIDHNDS